MKVLALHRYAVKGLGPDRLERVVLDRPGAAFPDDRRFALLKTEHRAAFDPARSDWIFKQKFLCAFTYGELLNRFATAYDDATRQLTVWDRTADGRKSSDRRTALGPVDLSTASGRDALAAFFAGRCGEPLSCVTAAGPEHTHQFGNTDEGFQRRGDSRTIHIVSASTVREVGETLGLRLSPEQFRPNIIVDGLEAWNDFDAVGKTLTVSRPDGTASTLRLEGLVRCVRCDGVGVDPLDPATPKVDVPKLLAKHYPKFGPFLGIYAVVATPGDIQVGDTITFPGEKVASPPPSSLSKARQFIQSHYVWTHIIAGVSLALLFAYAARWSAPFMTATSGK